MYLNLSWLVLKSLRESDVLLGITVDTALETAEGGIKDESEVRQAPVRALSIITLLIPPLGKSYCLTFARAMLSPSCR